MTNNPRFVNPAINDFRLRTNSPCYNAGYPNGSVRACLGYHTVGVRLADNRAGIVTTYTLTYAPRQDIPINTTIEIIFPSGFGLSGVSEVTTTSAWGGGVAQFDLLADGQTLYIQRTGGNTAFQTVLCSRQVQRLPGWSSPFGQSQKLGLLLLLLCCGE